MNLNETKLYQALEKNPSYFKKGKEFLGTKFGVSVAMVEAIKKAVRSQIIQDVLNRPTVSEIKTEIVNTEELGLPIKAFKKWQNASGKWLESYQYGNAIDNTPEQTLEEFEHKLLHAIQNESPIVKWKASDTDFATPFCYVVSITDFHIDQLDATSFEYKRELFMDKLYEIMDRVKEYNLSQIVFVIGNDFFNTEGSTQKTVKGTQQYNSVSWSDAFVNGYKLLVDAITMLTDIAPVQVISVQGNHSKTTEFYMANVLQAWFRNNQNVEIESSNQAVKYFAFGNNLIGLTHGEIKPHELPLIMATDVPEEWGKSKYREFLCGHIHKEKVNEYRGVKVRFLPSLVGSNEWHVENGYDHLQATQGILYHETKGFYALFELNIN